MAWVMVGTMAAGALAGKMKNDHARQVEESDRKLAAETQRYSPWTGLQAQPIRRAGSQFGDVFGGGVQGAMIGQQFGGMGGAPAKNQAFGGSELGYQAEQDPSALAYGQQKNKFTIG
jgi:hypothetical protein